MALSAMSLEYNQLRLDHFTIDPDPSAADHGIFTGYYVVNTTTGIQYFTGTPASVPLDTAPAGEIANDITAISVALAGAGYTQVLDPTTYNV